MGDPYTSVSVSGYNSSPPSDDGSTADSNVTYWATVTDKVGDPLNTAIAAVNANIVSAMGKIVGGAGVTSTAVTATVASSDQGKLYRATAASITITTPDASSVGSPFVFGLLNNSSGTITFAGNGAQTIDGSASLTIPAGTGLMCFTDGSNWFTTGLQGTLVGKQLGYSDIINATISESNGSNAATFALKTLAGTDPSATDPVLLCFRNATAGNGNYVYRTVTAALSLTISSGSNLGISTNSQPFRVWLVLFDDAGTIRMGAIQCNNSNNIYALGQPHLVSSTAEGGAGGADSAQTFYTASAVTSKPYLILGYCNYESGLATAGAWNVSPDVIQLFGPDITLPNRVIQSRILTSTTPTTINSTTKIATALADSITPFSGANVMEVEADGYATTPVASTMSQYQLYAATGTTALGSTSSLLANSTYGLDGHVSVRGRYLAATTSSLQFGLYGVLSSGTASFVFLSNASLTQTGIITIKEIQG